MTAAFEDIAREVAEKARRRRENGRPNGQGGGEALAEPENVGAATGAGTGEACGAQLEAAIDGMNRRYFVAGMGGRGVIASLVHDDHLRRERLVFSRPADIKLLFNHRHHVVGISSKGREIRRDLGTIWIEHPRRRTFERIALIPNGPTPPGVFNLWRGFGVEPRAGDWPLIRQHLLEVVCAGNVAHYDYLLGWMAHCVQHPERPAEVAVVLRGLKGTGKGMAGQMMVRLLRDHALQITHSRHLTGHFNAHLVDALFLFLDEAFWAGDKQGEGVLKALITERTLMIEPKGIDPFAMPNRLKILMASNNDWVVPASADERRYFVLDVSDRRRGDHAYFAALHAAIEGDELPALLAHLLAYDLAGFNLRAVPHTRALNEQKLLGADKLVSFWHDCLWQGAILGTGDMIWPEDVVVQVLHAAYVDYAHAHGDRHPAGSAVMAKKLKDLWPGKRLRTIRPRKPYGAIERPPRYALAGLEEHRAAFLAAMRIEAADYEWPEIEA